jgi:Prokaryotic RING finger family 1
MSGVVSCTCGAKIKLPESTADQLFRCPRCKAELQVPGALPIVTAVLAGPSTEGATCPVCQSSIAASDAVLVCPSCDQVHHRECWADVGGCATYGCENAPSIEKAAPAEEARTAWGDTKKCPACGETIKSIALRCRYCQTEFDTVDPLSMKDLHRLAAKEERLRLTRVVVIVLFVTSILGCLAPILLFAAPCYVLLKRKTIAKAGPVYLVMGYSAIAVSFLYSMLMLFFLLFSE